MTGCQWSNTCLDTFGKEKVETRGQGQARVMGGQGENITSQCMVEGVAGKGTENVGEELSFSEETQVYGAARADTGILRRPKNASEWQLSNYYQLKGQLTNGKSHFSKTH